MPPTTGRARRSPLTMLVATLMAGILFALSPVAQAAPSMETAGNTQGVPVIDENGVLRLIKLSDDAFIELNKDRNEHEFYALSANGKVIAYPDGPRTIRFIGSATGNELPEAITYDDTTTFSHIGFALNRDATRAVGVLEISDSGNLSRIPHVFYRTIDTRTFSNVALPEPAPNSTWDGILMSADGNAVAGRRYVNNNFENSYRWNLSASGAPTPSAPIVFPLHDGNKFTPYAMAANGQAIVGSIGEGIIVTPLIWKADASMAQPGSYTVIPLPAGGSGQQLIGISPDGKYAVGTGIVNDEPAAVVYDGTATHSIPALLQQKGVSIDTHTPIVGYAVTNDGTVISANDMTQTPLLIRNLFSSGSPAGVISVEDLQKSVTTMQVAPSAASGILRQTVGTLTSALQQTAPAPASLGGVSGGGASGGTSGGTPGSTSGGGDATTGVSSGDNATGHLRAWLVGTAVSDRDLAGTDQGAQGGAGLSWIFPQGISVGGGIFYGSRTIEGDYDSRQTVDDTGFGLFANYAPETHGLRLSGGLVYQLMDLDLKRGYANGSGSAASTATTDGSALTAMAQAGWVFPVAERLTVQPFISYSWSQMHIGGYEESGGPFNASFSGTDETANKTRNGAELTYAISDALSVWTWGAWNHRFESRGMAMSGSMAGVPGFSNFNLGGAKLDQDWFDTGVGVRWQAMQDFGTFLKVGTALDNRGSGEPDLTISLGFTWDM